MTRRRTDLRNSIIGSRHRAQARWYLILHRLRGTTPRNRHYATRELALAKEEFIAWFMKNDFKGCSVDRIDNSKGYTLSNLQLIPLAHNISKDKTAFDGTFHVCSKCKEKKMADKFTVDKRRLSGIGCICKKCDSRRNSKSTGA